MDFLSAEYNITIIRNGREGFSCCQHDVASIQAMLDHKCLTPVCEKVAQDAKRD